MKRAFLQNLAKFITAKNQRMLMCPAAERNKEHLLNVLKEYVDLETHGTAFEIASGPGTHITLFAQNYHNITWLASDLDAEYLDSINAYKTHYHLQNMRDPLQIDITTPVQSWQGFDLPEKSVDLMVNVNMIHISPWATAKGLFSAAGYLLKPQGLLFIYGPFAVHGKLTPESNVQFDQQLRMQNKEWGVRDLDDIEKNKEWGVRDLDDIEKLASENAMTLKKIHEMPANNKTLVFQKT